ncbi:hypothetical protein ABZ626_09490 [Streptomyces longispororuber]|uniref:hypothetical protein n=1 Tax=Streptomyces longispororuber TaxID=68230 RepID=UPI0033DC720B
MEAAAGVRTASGPGPERRAEAVPCGAEDTARGADAAPAPALTPAGHTAAVHAVADDLNGRGYPVTWVVDRRLLDGDFPLQVVAKVSVVRVLNIALDVRGDDGALVWRVSMGRPSSVRWEQSATLELGAASLDGERVVREALRAVGLPWQRAIHP